MTVDRRLFIQGLGAGVSSNAIFWAILEGSRPEFWERIRNFFPNETNFDSRYPDNVRAAKALFGDRGDLLKVAGGRAHHQYPNSMHPDDEWACETIIEYANRMAKQHTNEPNFTGTLEAGSFICAGSPVSNAWTRAFLEYAYVDRTRPGLGLRRHDEPRFKLPFEFVLDRETIGRTAKYPVHKTEKQRESVPNWSIRAPDGQIMSPNTKDRESDFLVITRIPNWKEFVRPRFGKFANTVTIIGGTHGVGTSATRLLLADNGLLAKILLTSAKYEFWQILLRVDAMVMEPHPHSKTERLVAKSINRHFECEPVTV